MANDKFISTSNLQSALKQYDNKISTKLGNKADKTYVDDSIANIPEVDLTSYAKKSEVPHYYERLLCQADSQALYRGWDTNYINVNAIENIDKTKKFRIVDTDGGVYINEMYYHEEHDCFTEQEHVDGEETFYGSVDYMVLNHKRFDSPSASFVDDPNSAVFILDTDLYEEPYDSDQDAEDYYDDAQGTFSLYEYERVELDSKALSPQIEIEEYLTVGPTSATPEDFSAAIGYNCEATGYCSFATGYKTIATDSYAHAEGQFTEATDYCAHAEGQSTKASGHDSHAEGDSTEATGTASHAQGVRTKATGSYSHAEGYYTEATTFASHAEGLEAVVKGYGSHAEGNRTIASGKYQHVQGQYNIEDTTNTYAHIVGNGTAEAKRSNAHTLDWNGNAWFAGDITVGTNKTKLVTAKDAVFENSISMGRTSGSTAGLNSLAFGYDAKATGAYSLAFGNHVEATASATYSGGTYTKATEIAAHAEGSSTTASAMSAHAEGDGTIASGFAAHAEGKEAHATASTSHVEGGYTIAASQYQHVQGSYNIEDANDRYLHIVGNGKPFDDGIRRNAHTLDWSGNAWYQGDVFVGGTSQDDANKLATEGYINTELSKKADASSIYTKTEVDQKVAGIVDSAPEALNTLNELAAALGDDPNFATTISTEIGKKANASNVYTKDEVNESVNNLYDEVARAEGALEVAIGKKADKTYVDTEISKIAPSDGDIKEKALYVSPTGSDSNDGTAKSKPLATIKKAIELGATTVLCERGEYYNQPVIQFTNQIGKKLKIAPSTKTNFSTDKPERDLIRIVFATKLVDMPSDNGLLTQAVSSTEQLKAVFVDKTTEPVVSNRNMATIWQMHEDFTLDKQLKPVLTKAECQAEDGTFFYDGANVYINPYTTAYTHFMLPTTGASNTAGIYLDGYAELILEDICVEFSHKRNICATNSMDCTIRNCRTAYSVYSDGLAVDYSNVNLYNCISFKNRNDGFNIHGYGESNFYNCSGFYNYDDGLSHHDGCYGVVDGGTYHHNGKGGISSPTYGAYIDIYNVECYENVHGVYAVSDTNNRQCVGKVFNSVLYNNTQNDLYVIRATITLYNTTYTTKTLGANAVLNDLTKQADLGDYVEKTELANYTTTAKHNELKSTVEELKVDLFGAGYDKVQLHTYIYSTDKWILSYNRATTIDSYSLKVGDTVDTDFTTYSLAYFIFDEDGNYIKGSGWSTSTLSIPQDGVYYFYLKKNDTSTGSAFTEEELVAAASTLVITADGISNDPGAITHIYESIESLADVAHSGSYNDLSDRPALSSFMRKSDYDYLYRNLYGSGIEYLTLELKLYNADDEKWYVSNTRASTPDYYYLSPGDVILTDFTKFKIGFYCFDTDGAYKTMGGWYTEPFVIKTEGNYHIVLVKADNTAFSSADLEEGINSIVIQSENLTQGHIQELEENKADKTYVDEAISEALGGDGEQVIFDSAVDTVIADSWYTDFTGFGCYVGDVSIEVNSDSNPYNVIIDDVVYEGKDSEYDAENNAWYWNVDGTWLYIHNQYDGQNKLVVTWDDFYYSHLIVTKTGASKFATVDYVDNAIAANGIDETELTTMLNNILK